MASGTSGGGGGLARLLAIIAAIALIAGGLLIRTALDDDGGSGDGGDDPPTSTTTDDRAAATEVICITELQAACDKIEQAELGVTVRTEPAGTTLDTLADLDDARAPLWITIEPFPAMVDELRTLNRQAPFEYEVQPTNETQLGLVVGKGDKWTALTSDECGSSVWRCLGDWAGDQWADHGALNSPGRILPAVGDAENSAIGLAGLAVAVAGYNGTGSLDAPPDPSLDTNFGIWLDELKNTAPVGATPDTTPLATMVARASALNAVSATTAEFASYPTSRTENFETQYPEPSMWATAVLAEPSSSSAPDDLIEQVTLGLRNAGWADIEPERSGAPLPDASIMLALRELWRNS